MQRKDASKLRIISGRWRGRNLQFDPKHAIRPTPNRVRETLFNWLQPYINGAKCLDLFAGSGALGFEAASRGAHEVVLVDHKHAVCAQLQSEVERFEADNISVVCEDALSYISKAEHADICFIDPPFSGGMLAEILSVPELAQKADLLYVEMPAGTEIPACCAAWQQLQRAQAGDVVYCLYTTN